MTPIHTRWLAAAGCLASLISLSVPGCSDDPGSSGGTAGSAGTGGVAGAGGMGGEGGMGGAPPLPLSGLWEGQSRGVDICFYVDDDETKLIGRDDSDPDSSSGCNLTGEPEYSFDLAVQLVGVDQSGQPCSFDLGYEQDVTIDQGTGSFRASMTEPGSGAVLSFSGEFVGELASGIARRDEGELFCRAGWQATISRQCDDAAINDCLDLLNCCRAILINPVFFETCNAVAQRCDRVECLRALAGYPQCTTEL